MTIAIPPTARPSEPAARPAPLTVEEYLAHPASRERTELIRGQIVPMSPSNLGHGVIASNLQDAASPYVRHHRLGRWFGNDTGFDLPIPRDATSSVRAPDGAFVRADRLPPGGVPLRGYGRLAPDLAAEVLSPGQTAADIDVRMRDYFAAGTRLFWVINPFARTVAVHSPVAPTRWLDEGDTLDAGDVMPGFTMPVADLFDGVARE
jgi:Uma2 family endonuclease